jgi:hypothetical protein
MPWRCCATSPSWSSGTASAGSGSSWTSTRTSTTCSTSSAPARTGDGNLCAIGDPDQAIYSFRGADVGYFLRFSLDFTDARLVRLTRNYRSSAPILAAAVQAIAPTTLVHGRRLDPARLNPSRRWWAATSRAASADEADFVVRTVDELVGGLSHRSLDSGRVDSRAVAPARCPSRTSPCSTAPTRRPGRSWRRCRGPAYRCRSARTTGCATGRRAGDRARAAARRRPRRSLAARVKLTAQVLAQRYAAPTLDAEQLAPEDIWTAADCCMPLAHRIGDDLPRFLQEIATGAEVDALDPRAEAVNLLTLHAAKGLEFPVVFLVGCEDGCCRCAGPARPADDETGRGAPAVLRRADPGAGPAVRDARGAAVPARQRARAVADAVPGRHRRGLFERLGDRSRPPQGPAAQAA